jgi:hypothetical protein
MNASIVFITVGGIAALILAAKGGLHFADELFRYFAERNGF